ncbi:MAG: hypothetical protein GXO90_02390 [FCB group bacterium]|nr:hypothetical protein [FCB group bacterium]
MKKLILNTLLVTLGMGFMAPVMAQDLQSKLETMAKNNAEGYLGPAVTAFGMGVNSGTFHTAKPHKMLGFDVTINVAATAITDAGKTYDYYIPPIDVNIPIDVNGTSYNVTLNLDDVYESDRTSSTLFGENTSNAITADENTASDAIYSSLASQTGYSEATLQSLIPQTTIANLLSDYVPTINTPKGYNLPAFPMVMPQVSIGLPMSIELTLRGFPETDLGGGMGKLSFVGFGGKIGLNQFIPIPNLVLPRIAVGYYMTTLNMADVITANNSIATLQVSKSIPFLTVYGGIGLESSSMEVNYDYQYTDLSTNQTSTQNVNFTLDGKNTFRTMVGVRLKLAIISINADYNIGEFNTFNLGLGLTLR